MTPSASGKIVRPARSADMPRAFCKKRETRYKVPKNAIEPATITDVVDLNSRSTNSDKSISGWIRRSSYTTKQTKRLPPDETVATTSPLDHPTSGPSEMPYMASPSPAPERRNPQTSRRLMPDCLWSERKTKPKTKAAMPKGTFT